MLSGSKYPSVRNGPDGGPLIEWGKRRLIVRLAVAIALESIKTFDQAARNLLWDSLVQGMGKAPDSRGTHETGFAVDFSLRDVRWDRKVAYFVCTALEEVGFAVAVRREGELSPGSVRHIHAALIPYSNSGKITRAHRFRPLERQLIEAFPGEEVIGRKANPSLR